MLIFNYWRVFHVTSLLNKLLRCQVMSFKCFVYVYKKLLQMTTNSEITSLLATMRDKHNVTLDEMRMWLCLLVALSQKRRISDKHLLTVFSKIETPHIDRGNLAEAFKLYGVAETCASVVKSNGTCSLTVADAYFFFEKLKTITTKSVTLLAHFKTIIPKCDRDDVESLITFIRDSGRNRRVLCKKRNIQLFKQVLGKKSMKTISNNAVASAVAGKPVDAMLALPCKDFNQLNYLNYCVEIKYDGERLQVHKLNDGSIVCYKRNMNAHTKCLLELLPYLEDALRDVDNAIIDGELMDDNAGFIAFDLLIHNDKNMMNVDLKTRKMLLSECVKSNDRVVVIEYHECNDRNLVVDLIKRYLKEDVEGVVVKDMSAPYECKKKKWIKIKKSYFENVCSADLVVVGGWKPIKDKRIVIYLVASPYYDYTLKMWRFVAVSKVKIAKHNLEDLMKPVDVTPDWLVLDADMKHPPNMVALNPESMPVWELQGDFIRSATNKVSIRLPRFIRIRNDKNFQNATRMFELKILASILNTPNLLNDEILVKYFLKDNLKQKEST
ncbi:DNA ligase [Trichoplusia ni granulovirus LBIV-12]|uniref:DNA ligase n=2 Tax=Betabaculovirus TaxID=558017 RepID=A0A1D8QLG6_GVTN|nr:DNA ligase [Pseudalatia unipuncta granulovirus]YP_009506208.1 DNA ligase [Trichoplusia ni granulovirus LBIV-12]ACH69498.1 DNA ligase [Pseudalatia unipuncta granulovirus]AOW41476.1 DNA ligase [Trichoplusia ni granulovirus LBIV-12]